MCLKIKNELESLGFKVWIDVSEIHGSSLDSMAKAVEEASCILMCVTEKYRQSLNCQSEAQYAHRLNKVIIPLIMQSGYHHVKGWLGIIIGDKIFVDFTKYSFGDSISRLKKQIDLNINKTIAVDNVHINQVIPDLNNLSVANKLNENQPKKSGPKYWTNDQVKEWFEKNEITDLHKILVPINGRLLSQLYEIKIHTPEFFYKSLVKNDHIDIKKVAIFSDLLMELFE